MAEGQKRGGFKKFSKWPRDRVGGQAMGCSPGQPGMEGGCVTVSMSVSVSVTECECVYSHAPRVTTTRRLSEARQALVLLGSLLG